MKLLVFKMESKALVQRLKGIMVEVNSHQSTLSADQVLKIKSWVL